MSRLTDNEKNFLLRLARQSLEAAVRPEAKKALEIPDAIPPGLDQAAGAFVTLHKRGHLRGCVGYVHALKPLYQTVMEAAAAAAVRDPRFPPVEPAELADLEVEISVLSPCQPVRPEEIQVGVHGLLITRNQARGLLLPQVAVEHHWSRERFLEETCRKAALPADAWRQGATIEAFTAEVFGGESLAGNGASG